MGLPEDTITQGLFDWILLQKKNKTNKSDENKTLKAMNSLNMPVIPWLAAEM